MYKEHTRNQNLEDLSACSHAGTVLPAMTVIDIHYGCALFTCHSASSQVGLVPRANKVLAFLRETCKPTHRHADENTKITPGVGHTTCVLGQDLMFSCEPFVGRSRQFVVWRQHSQSGMDKCNLIVHDDGSLTVGIGCAVKGACGAFHHQTVTLTKWANSRFSAGGVSNFCQGLLGRHESRLPRRLFRTFAMEPNSGPAATDGHSQQNGDDAAAQSDSGRNTGGGAKCQEIRKLLPDYVLNHLSKEDERWVSEHLGTCKECDSLTMSLEAEIMVLADDV
jgi:Putative zinc-finger